jgi:hypothetical protein
MQQATDTPTVPVTPEGQLLSHVYGRLVRWHYILAAANGSMSTDTQAQMMHEIMATLGRVEENPRFRAADDAEQVRRGTPAAPTAPA